MREDKKEKEKECHAWRHGDRMNTWGPISQLYEGTALTNQLSNRCSGRSGARPPAYGGQPVCVVSYVVLCEVPCLVPYVSCCVWCRECHVVCGVVCGVVFGAM